MVCQRSPSGYGSGLDAWSGSSNTSIAVSNDKPFLAQFAAALFGMMVAGQHVGGERNARMHHQPHRSVTLVLCAKTKSSDASKLSRSAALPWSPRGARKVTQDSTQRV